MNYWTQSEKNIYVAAHRGWYDQYPENTMEAFRAALTLGVDQIETDVRVSSDGELVLIHDHTLDRTTNGTGEVLAHTFAELRALDAGSWKDPKFAGCRIPTLREFMDLVSTHPTITVDIELKVYPKDGREELAYSVCDRVMAMIEEYNFSDRCVINTFSGKLHEYIQEKYGNRYRQHVYFPLRYLGECTKDPYSYAYCCCMFSQEKGLPMATAQEFAEMRAHGVRTWAGAGVRTEAAVDQAIACGAELITCNNPDVILDILRQKGYHK